MTIACSCSDNLHRKVCKVGLEEEVKIDSGHHLPIKGQDGYIQQQHTETILNERGQQ